MGFWSKLFGAKTRTSKLSGDSPYLPKKKDEVEVIFAKLFTQKGGKFIYSEDGKSSDHYFKLILEENHWKNENVLCFDKNLSDRFHISCQPINIDANEFKVFLISCEYLIANKGSILICNHQLKDFKLDNLPPYIIVYSGLDNFVNDVSEGMTNLKNKYSNRLPSNICLLYTSDAADD